MHMQSMLDKLGVDTNVTRVETPLLPSLEVPAILLAALAFFLHLIALTLTLTSALLRQQPRSKAIVAYLVAGLVHNGLFVPLATADTVQHQTGDAYSAVSFAAVTVYTLCEMAALLSLSCLAILDILDCGHASPRSCLRSVLPDMVGGTVYVVSLCTALLQLTYLCFNKENVHLHEPFPEGPYGFKLAYFIVPLALAIVTAAILTLTWFCGGRSNKSPKLHRELSAVEPEASVPLLRVAASPTSPPKDEFYGFPADVVIIVWITVICTLPQFFVIYNPKEANEMHANMWTLTWLYRCLRQLTVPTVWLLTEPYRLALLRFRHAVAKLVRKAFWGSNDALLVRTQPPCIICNNEVSLQNGGSSRVTFLQPNVSHLSSFQNGGTNHMAALHNGGPDHVISQHSENSSQVIFQQNDGVNHVTSMQHDGGCSLTSSQQSEDSCTHKASLQSGSSSHVMSPLLSTSHAALLIPGSTNATSLSNSASCHVPIVRNGVTNRGSSAACRSDAAGRTALRPCQILQRQTGVALAAAPGSPPVEFPPFQFCLDIPETRC